MATPPGRRASRSGWSTGSSSGDTLRLSSVMSSSRTSLDRSSTLDMSSSSSIFESHGPASAPLTAMHDQGAGSPWQARGCQEESAQPWEGGSLEAHHAGDLEALSGLRDEVRESLIGEGLAGARPPDAQGP